MKVKTTTALVLIALSLTVVMGTVAQETLSSQDYAVAQTEVQSIAENIRGARTQEERDGYINGILKVLFDFREKYPDSPEAWDAAFDIGLIKQQLGEFGEAAQYLYEFILNASAAPKEKHGYAHFYLAETFLSAGKTDDAEAEFKLVVSDYSDDARLKQFATSRLQTMDSERRLAIGAEPIAFSVKSTSGENLSPAKYKGKVLLLDFWATWCRPCIAEMPNVKRVYDKYKDQGFEIVGISLDKNRTDLDSYVRSNKIEWPQFFDGKYWQNELAVQYGVKSIPITFLIDRNGKIRYKSLRGKQLETAVEQLLAENS